MAGPETTIIFVYNADSSPLAQVFDWLHKAALPKTYACNVCRVTYGKFAAKQEWTEFVQSLAFRTVFLHRNEFRERHPELKAIPLPAIFIEEEGLSLKIMATAEELNRPQNAEEMKALILSKLA
jgi:hypothetical protein